ncbi:hypothetical protein N7537_003850 [Penicillium hordei]|uniref:Tse2 ADP-ribosyltransferase toxin domain-containing protein n=1 Tax=Penicillium hordei TaxID=40994 RepID=A0AAD6EA69_9EURO|nr:uncharacterized protein N7537_003850 [Penicillium hordei]KAJ5607231.1 hypothetical protein N7537_003850 [Penicillium hordei]
MVSKPFPPYFWFFSALAEPLRSFICVISFLCPESKLFDKKLEQDDWEWEDGIEVTSDGLVYPKISLDVSNGALFMPNTHFTQAVTRRSFDNYLNATENGQPAASSLYLSISKVKQAIIACIRAGY